MNRRWMAGLIALAGLIPIGTGAAASPADPFVDRFSFPVGAVPNSPTASPYQAPDGRSYVGWTVNLAASFLSPGYGLELQPGEDWGGRGGAGTALGQPVYAAAAGTIVAAGDYGANWGHIVLIRHTLPGGQVVLTQYAYLADITKSSGTVGWRELIGHIGMSRRGAVLHFEVRRDSLIDAPADYWPTSDGKDVDWVRMHYYSPTQFVRTHYRILAPLQSLIPSGPFNPPGASPGTAPDPVVGTVSPDSPGTLFPGTLIPGTLTPSGTPGTITSLPPLPSPSAWDGVPHLDGSILKSAAGAYYLLQNGKRWLIPTEEILSTWARPTEVLLATDEELASYPDGGHPIGLRSGTFFKGPSGPVCISDDPFGEPGLVCWVIADDAVFAALHVPQSAILTVTAKTMGLYLRPTPFGKNDLLPHGTLIKKPYGAYYVVEDLHGPYPEVHPVTSPAALHSWQMEEGMAVEVGDEMFWERAYKQDPLRFRPGAILQSDAGQLFVVTGEYKRAAPDPGIFRLRGYNAANGFVVTAAELALEKDWPATLR